MPPVFKSFDQAWSGVLVSLNSRTSVICCGRSSGATRS